MSIIGISKFETSDYISSGDPARSEAEGATIFILGSLDVDSRAQIQDNTVSYEADESGKMNMRLAPAARMLMAVRLGLRGWRNFKDENGNDILFETVDRVINGKLSKVVSDKALGHLPSSLIIELGNQIIEKNTLNGDITKN